MCGLLLSGWGWSWFPVLGMLMCLGFFVLMFVFSSRGRGFMCMGGHRGTHDDHVADTPR